MLDNSPIKGSAVSVLILSQVYAPDEASVGQLLEDLARTLIAKGRSVQVITSDRGYDEPRRRFTHLETRFGVSVRRTFAPAAPKRSVVRRVLGGVIFLIGACWHVLWAPRFDVLLISTSPPMAPLVGVLLARLRGARSVVWLTDLNPDEAVAAGVVARGSIVERLARQWARWGLQHADVVVTLDRQMERRALDDGALPSRLHVIPPWSSIEHAAADADVRGFRESQGWSGRRVIMYAGNHSPVHPLDTVVRAAVSRPRGDSLQFAFVGGGSMKPKIDLLREPNVSTLPYQPRESLPVLLAAADVHVVSMGDAVTGIVHPSKFYGALAAGRPVLFIGSAASVIGRVVTENDIGWVVPHGDLDTARRTLDAIAQMTEVDLCAMGERALATHRTQFEPARIRARLADAILGDTLLHGAD